MRTAGKPDFLVLKGAEGDVAFLRGYLDGTGKDEVGEDYNMFTRGEDKAGNPMFVLYWEGNEGLRKKGIVVINDRERSEAFVEEVVRVLEEECLEGVGEQEWERKMDLSWRDWT